MGREKQRTHVICEKVPIIAMILSIFLIILFMTIFDSLTKWISRDNAALYNTLSAIVALLILFIINLWFSPTYKGSTKASVSPFQIKQLLLLFIVYFIVNTIISLVGGTFIFEPTIEKLGQALNAGFSEEVMFRAATIPIGLHYIKSSKNVTLTWIYTSIIFGVLHLLNIQGGGSLSVIAIQAIAATFMGIYFASLFMCTGSIFIPIFIHGFWDYFCFVTDETLENGIMTQASVDLALIIACLVNVVLGVISILYIQKHQDTIKRIWNEKWNC